jgi:hypothetical protein
LFNVNEKMFYEENQITLHKKVPNPTGSGPTTLKKMKSISSETRAGVFFSWSLNVLFKG